MISLFKAISWLRAIDNKSCLNKEDRKLIEAIAKYGLLDVNVAPLLENLRNTARLEQGDAFRKAELLLWCAAIGYSRGLGPQAAREAQAAVGLYDTDNHRRAVALWIRGIIQWEMRQNLNAYENWTEAKKIFERCQALATRSPSATDWYKNPIRQMKVELIARPEEISTWLNQLDYRSSLGVQTGRIVRDMREKIRQRAYPNIYALTQDLQEASKWGESAYETAEMYLQFGLAAYQMSYENFAIDLLRNAVQSFFPGIGTYHKHVVARCMLGALEWMDISLYKQASADWVTCIDELEKLQWLADRDGSQEKEEWYSERCGILRSALLQRVKPPEK